MFSKVLMAISCPNRSDDRSETVAKLFRTFSGSIAKVTRTGGTLRNTLHHVTFASLVGELLNHKNRREFYIVKSYLWTKRSFKLTDF